ncbi:hypothetical protein [Diaphorobacter aerolatus]|uniref:Uncharacterized protein n=1 Tax=Diaphorobacter aerolatus TaxID=1288495 RepID=A0A7H0GIH3_9BURK|nr:hypothetical protein [Diaphorobacter aerolatus]QNP48089.1 hypothetical protein H9K75_18765 [Diaphorobacter aerolatus]
MSTLHPNAEASSVSTATTSSREPQRHPRRILHIAFWGREAQAHAAAFALHASGQVGWSERLQVSAHDLLGLTTPEQMRDWLRAELETAPTRPHLCLLVPSSARDAIASELQLRNALAEAAMGYQVLYGSSLADCVASAANAVALTAKAVLPSIDRACFVVSDTGKPLHPRMRSWNCEKCSDPDCEHRLFTDLLGAR